MIQCGLCWIVNYPSRGQQHGIMVDTSGTWTSVSSAQLYSICKPQIQAINFREAPRFARFYLIWILVSQTRDGYVITKKKSGRIRLILYSSLVPSAPWPRLLEERASVSPPSPGLLHSRHSQNRNRISQSWACEMNSTPDSQMPISAWLLKRNSTLQGFYWCTRSNSRSWGHIR